MLLMWVYFSWAAVLLGCEIAYAYQNEATFALERYADEASYAYREAVGLRAMVDIGYRFDRGLPGLTVEDAAREWNVPMRLLADELESLVAAGLIAGRATEPVQYQPARPLDRITAQDILRTLRQAGTDPSRFREDERFRKMFDELERATGDFASASLEDLVAGYAEAIDRSGEPAPSVNA
jgi:DNA-binding IscR family transcriptional regulator